MAPMKRELYPDNWDDIARKVKKKAGWKCEECGQKHITDTAVHILTVHHKDGNPANNEEDNLVALCAPCHLRAERRKKRGMEGQPRLPLE